MFFRSGLALALVLALLPLGGSSDAHACSCLLESSDEFVRQVIDGVDVVAEGELTAVHPGRPSVIELRVERIYKGDPPRTITYREDGACGMGYASASPGRKQFVSLKRQPDGSYREAGCASFPLLDPTWAEFHATVTRLVPLQRPALMARDGDGSAWSVWLGIAIAAGAAGIVGVTLMRDRGRST